MKRFSIILLPALLFLSGCSGEKNIKSTVNSEIEIAIEQEGQTVPFQDGRAEIRKSPFTILVKLKSGDGILVNASFSPDSFNNAKMGLPIDQIGPFNETGIAEELFNRKKTLFVSGSSANFWYYSDETDHRFSSVAESDGIYICRREIQNITDLDKENSAVDLIQLSEDTLYFVVMKAEWNKDYTKQIEIARKIFTIKFTI